MGNEEMLDFLFVHVPKKSNFYEPIDDFMFINYLPMGVFALCDLLNEAGYRSRILHMGVEVIRDKDFSIVDWLADKDVKVVGFSIHWHFQSFDVIDIAKKIKEKYPEKYIVLGGYTASRFAEEIVEKFECIDGVLRGDAEEPVKALMNALNEKKPDLKHVPNLVRREKGAVVDNGISYVATEDEISRLNFGKLPLLYNYETYIEYISIPLFWMNNASLKANKRFHEADSPVFPLFIGRGCSVDCTFCGGSRSSLKKIGNRTKIIFRSIPSVLQTIRDALSYGYKTMNISFQPFPKKDQYFLDLFKAIRDEGIKTELNFECWGLPTEEFVKAFSLTFPGKVSSIALSPETGSEELRKKNKGMWYTNEEMFAAMDVLKKYKVVTDIFFTIGVVGESEEDIAETRKVIHKLYSKYHAVLRKIIMIPVQLEPASPIFEDPDKYGFTVDRKSFMDFYNSHGKADSGPFTYLGFTNDVFFNEKLDSYVFSKRIQDVRCKYFCHLTPKIFHLVGMPFMGRFICKMMCKRWIKKGFGHIPNVRRTFE